MDVRTCDSCGEPLADLFWAVQIQIRKGVLWTALERDRATRLLNMVKAAGNLALAGQLQGAEPATFPGDTIPSLVTQGDLRICLPCVLKESTSVNLIDLVRAAERRGSDVSPPKTA
jgi:hypothetical protein